MALKTIVNFRSTKDEKYLMCREAKRRGVTLSVFLSLLWEEDKERRDNWRKLKDYVRQVTNRLVKQGVIKKGVCEDCGDSDVVPHHEDYYNPYKVVWVCKKHHKGKEAINDGTGRQS